MLFRLTVVTSGGSGFVILLVPSMYQSRRINLPCLLYTACVCWALLYSSSTAQGSCGNYLHSRLGPPPAVAIVPAEAVQTIRGLKTLASPLPLSSLPRPCSGPNCGRSSLPPLSAPAGTPVGSGGPDEQGFAAPTGGLRSADPGFAEAETAPLRPMVDPHPIDMPPDC